MIKFTPLSLEDIKRFKGFDELPINHYAFNYDQRVVNEESIQIFRAGSNKFIKLNYDVKTSIVKKIKLCDYSIDYNNWMYYALPLGSYFVTKDLTVATYGRTNNAYLTLSVAFTGKPCYDILFDIPITKVLDLEKVPWN